MTGTPQGKKPDRKPIPGAMEYAGAGLQFALGILLFLYLGQWLDGKLGTAPWLTILGVFVGFGASFYAIVSRLGRKDGPKERR
jgi:ATP synthase protein I